MSDPTPEQLRAFLASARASRHAWHCFQKSSRRTALRITRTPASRKDTLMPQTAALPLDPARLADLLLAPGVDTNTLYRQLADQVGARLARRVLAGAHSIAAERLWAETA